MFDASKMRAVILYALNKCDPSDIGAVKLHKVLYYLDMISYADLGRPVTGAKYVKRPHGPVNSKLLALLSKMESDREISISEVEYYGYLKKQFTPLKKPDSKELSNYEASLLDEVVDFVCKKNSAKTISEYSHNRAWEIAEFGDEIPYRRAYMLFPSEVSSEAFEATLQGMRETDARQGGRGSVEFTNIRDFRSRFEQANSQRNL
jgi:hypothetical protein